MVCFEGDCHSEVIDSFFRLVGKIKRLTKHAVLVSRKCGASFPGFFKVDDGLTIFIVIIKLFGIFE